MTSEAIDEPRVSIIVTFFNQAQWVDQALDSVAVQTEPRFQLIIADDGSTDATRERILAWIGRHDGLGETVFAARNGGLPALLNLALPRLRGRLVMVLNGDDWLDPLRLEHQANALAALPETVGLVYSDLRVVDIEGQRTGEIFPPADLGRPTGNLLLHLTSGPLFGMPCVMFRRSILDTIGPWDESLVADDFDFLLRAAAAGWEFAYAPFTDTNYRQYGSSLTGSRNAVLADGRISALLKIRGRDDVTDRAIDLRVRELAIALHANGYDRAITRRRLRLAVRHSPSPRVIRAAVESHLRIAPGCLSPRYWTRRVSRKSSGRPSGAVLSGRLTAKQKVDSERIP